MTIQPESIACPTQSCELNKAEHYQLPNPVVWTEKFHSAKHRGHQKPTPKNTLVVQIESIQWKSQQDRKQRRLSIYSEMANHAQTSLKANVKRKKMGPLAYPCIVPGTEHRGH